MQTRVFVLGSIYSLDGHHKLYLNITFQTKTFVEHGMRYIWDSITELSQAFEPTGHIIINKIQVYNN